MKLYTEEQVRTVMLHSYLSGVERPSDYLLIEESILNELTPIELPTDKEIEQECNNLPFENHVDSGMYNDDKIDGFELGAKWMKEQIINQNK